MRRSVWGIVIVLIGSSSCSLFLPRPGEEGEGEAGEGEGEGEGELRVDVDDLPPRLDLNPELEAACPAGTVDCNGGARPLNCVDLATTAEHCGECNLACDDDEEFCNGAEVCVDGGCVHAPPPCGSQGCNEAERSCGSCNEQFPCPGSESFCDDVNECDAGTCTLRPRCDDDDAPLCIPGSTSVDPSGELVGIGPICAACVDDSDCDDGDDRLLCNGYRSCVANQCVDVVTPCGDLRCTEALVPRSEEDASGPGCFQCSTDAECGVGSVCDGLPTGFCLPL
ncbi:MAG: hypothetical protein Q8O67_23000 [Deltaproteobacteria bacterium]|nr:hypothetical protein [Deltaproteobacteria bacterium]